MILTEEKLVPFALRLRPGVKEAAKAITEAHWYVPSENGLPDYVDGRGGGSLNDELQKLLNAGLKVRVKELEHGIAEAKKEVEQFQDLVRFFMDNPAASYVLPINLPEGSKGRAWLEDVMEVQPEDFHNGESRAEATREYASAQERLFRLTTALGAVQKAIR